jgi:hypothetical protein
MSVWSMLSDASTSRMALIRVCGAAIQPAWPALLPLDRRRLLGERHVERRQSPVRGTA